MGMSGWRIGYVIASKIMISQLLKLNQHITTCASTVLQMHRARFFDQIIRIILPQAEKVVNKRRMIRYLDSIGLSYLEGNSTFYIFIKVENLKVGTLDFCLFLLFKYGVAIVPGSAYGESTKDFVRVGIGAESEERLVKAFDIIKLVYDGQKTDVNYVNRRLKSNGYYRVGEEKYER